MPFEEVVLWLFELIRQHGSWSVFAGIILEEIIVPLPSSLILMGAGAFLVPAGIPAPDAAIKIFFTIAVPASFGTVIGSFFLYAAGYYGGRRILKRFSRFLDFSWDDAEKTGRKLGKGRKTWISVFLLRLIPVFPTSPVSFLAGTLRLDAKKYAAATFIGAVPRNFILAFFGWYFGSSYVSVAGGLNLAEDILLLTMLLFAAYFLHRHHRKIARHIGNRLRSGRL